MTTATNKYILQKRDIEWFDEHEFVAADGLAAEKYAAAYLEQLKPEAGTAWRLLRYIGVTEIVYKEPPPPPEPELEQLSFS